jgi:Ulp1 protease family, C-terminal catalytic domain
MVVDHEETRSMAAHNTSSSNDDCGGGGDVLIVNYNDACIYGRDLTLLLRRSEWLNDSCIHYWFQRLLSPSSLLREAAAAACASTPPGGKNGDDTTTLSPAAAAKATTTTKSVVTGTPSIALLDPTVVSFFMHQCTDDDDIEEFLQQYNFFDRVRTILIPINDALLVDLCRSSSTATGTGTHWSLLVVAVCTGTAIAPVVGVDAAAAPAAAAVAVAATADSAQHNRGPTLALYHCDSVRDSPNAAAACAVGRKLASVLGGTPSEPSSISIIKVDVPRQRNGYDCGLHVLAAAELLLQDRQFPVQEVGARLHDLFSKDQNYCAKLRKRIADDILDQAAAVAATSAARLKESKLPAASK